MVVVSSCIEEFPYNVPETVEKIPVINAFLNPDSLIKISLYWSVPVADTLISFKRIIDAHVILYENGRIICDTFPNTDEPLMIARYPREDSTYSMCVVLPNGDTLQAKTTIPRKINFSLKDIPCESKACDMGYSVRLTDDQTGKYPLWLIALTIDTANVARQAVELYSNNGVADDMNKAMSPDNPFSEYNFVFTSFLRFNQGSLKKDDRIDFMPLFPVAEHWRKYSSICLIAASPEYDRYCRTEYLQLSFDAETDTPFRYQPVRIFSNITNGQGIFAGFSISEVRLSQ